MNIDDFPEGFMRESRHVTDHERRECITHELWSVLN